MSHPSTQEHKQTQSLVSHDAEVLVPVKAWGWPGALELAGERLITTYGKRWMLGAISATATLGPAGALLLHTQAKHAVEPSRLLISGLILAACGVLMSSCMLAWPKLLYDARAVIHAPMTAPPEQPWRTFSLTKTLKRTFGPILILITPPRPCSPSGALGSSSHGMVSSSPRSSSWGAVLCLSPLGVV